ncbi:MAG: TIGR00282 family metallophosphoesterase [Gemmataceae bacterium]
MRILFVGDVVGSPGVDIVKRAIPLLRKTESLDCVIVNAENATNGAGLSPKDYRTIRSGGVDAITLGDHVYKKFDITNSLVSPHEPIVKPANYPSSAPGKVVVKIPVGDTTVAVISVMGRTFMRSVDCPFAALDRVLASLPKSIKVIVVDAHAEATADKYLIGRYLDGRVTAVLGTHTHVPTADEQILPEGTAFQCDVGMTGPYESILGRRIDRVMHTAITFQPSAFDVATGDVRLAGTIVECNPETGKATAIRRVCFRESELTGK